MSEKHMLERFHGEVMMSGSEATLPINLSDYWLTEIQLNLELFFDSMEISEKVEGEIRMSLPLAAIMHILLSKSGGKAVDLSLDEMFRHFEDYRIELGLEELRRKMGLRAEPPTIASIFTNRDVSIF